MEWVLPLALPEVKESVFREMLAGVGGWGRGGRVSHCQFGIWVWFLLPSRRGEGIN